MLFCNLTETDSRRRLEEYRQETQDLTRTILALARARQKISLKIADVKQALGSDIENHAVEDKLSATMLAYARRVGLDQDMAKSMISMLIEHSKIVQRRRINMKLTRSYLFSNGVRTVSVIGVGRMGTWFARYFRDIGKRVILYDGNKKRALERSKETNYELAKSFEEASTSDLMIVAVPITSTTTVIRKLIRSINSRRRVRIVEISSIKSSMSKANLLDDSKLPQNVELYSIHPLFGPNANSYSVNTLIQVGKSTDFVRGLFPHFRLLTMDWKEHDELMSMILTLPHSHALAFADTLKKLGRIPKGIGSPSFESMLELSRKVLSENPDIYYEIQAENPFSSKAINMTISSLTELRRSLKARKAFRSFFNTNLLEQD